MADDLITGIDRAVAFCGTQVELAKRVSDITNTRVAHETVSHWSLIGYVPGRYIPAVARLTGIPVTDLMRKTPRKTRSDKGIRRSNGAGQPATDQH